MKNKTVSIWYLVYVLFTVCTLTALLPATAVKGEETSSCTEYSGSNAGAQDYLVWADTVKSYLTSCGDGTLMRFQYVEGSDGYLVEYYDASYQLLRTKTIAPELPVFGAFYESKSNYFVITGQENKKESAKVECYRITKYDKNWKCLKSVGLYDCNTAVPFAHGSVRVAEQGNLLLVRTCHTMYATKKGENPQADATILVNMKKLKIENSYMKGKNHAFGYVSTSYNQFIQSDGGRFVAVEHGNAYPRALVLIKCGKDANAVSDTSVSRTLLKIPGQAGDVHTGVSVGGFEVSDKAYLVAGNKIDFDNAENQVRNIFVASIKKTAKKPTLHQITDYKQEKDSASTPHLVKLGGNEFLLLWQSDGYVHYTKIGMEGKPSGKIYKLEGNLSDCVPLLLEKKIVWYTWEDGIVTFHEIDRGDIAKNCSTTVQTGHTYECRNVKKNVAVLKCSKCGKEKKVATPVDFTVFWQEEGGKGGKYRSAYTNPFKVGECMKYLIQPEWGKADVAAGEDGDFLIEVSESGALEITEEEESGKGTIRLLKEGEYVLVIRHRYDDSLRKEFIFEVEE